MSEALLLQNTVNKPGTSCLGCRRRKLKCSREPEGCFNCTKSDLPCVYPQPDVGVKRKRGPYKKDKPPRQRHLEDLVKYLEPKTTPSQSPSHGDSASPARASSSAHSRATPHPITAATNGQPPSQSADQQTLVTDALVALTRSAAIDEDLRNDHGGFGAHQHAASAPYYTRTNPHPTARHIFDYWHLFVTRVDPMVKIIHCPTFYEQILRVIDDPVNVSSHTNAILFSIYYAALCTCSAHEARRRFGDSQEILSARYGKCITNAIRATYDLPRLESLQALVLYLACVRHSDQVGDFGHLFHEAVRCAQLLKLEQDPEGSYLPFEAEYRRRLWFHLCGLETRTAEEGGSRKYSILKGQTVQMPRNLNDCDLNPRMTVTPRSREGIADSTFSILRFEIHALVFGIWNIRSGSPADAPGVTERQKSFYALSKERLNRLYMRYMDESRPYDWLCKTFVEGMLIKACLIIDFHTGTVPTNTMSMPDRMTLLKSSVQIIKSTHALAGDERISDWMWYFRGYVQWHSIAIVVAELGWSRNEEFVTMAWNVLDDVLADWDTIFNTKRDDPAWSHVNDFIQRARKLRKFSLSSGAPEGHFQHKKPRHTAPLDQTSVPALPGGLAHSMANLRKSLQHRPAAKMNNKNNEGQSPESQTSGGSGPSDGISPSSNESNFDMDPFPEVNWNAYNSVFTHDVWDTWEHVQNMKNGMHNDPADGNDWPAQQNIMPNYRQFPG